MPWGSRRARRAAETDVDRDLTTVHLLLTDRLTCPRCGPTFGLIVRADRTESRAVLDGVLGCPNCRDSFPVTDGFADLRAPPRREMPVGLAGGPPGDDAERIAALLGVPRGPGTIALVGEPARAAASLVSRIEDVQVAAVDPDLRLWPEHAGVSRLASAPGLPFFGSGMRAVAVDARLGPAILAEAARVVAPGGRVVVVHAGADERERIVQEGLKVLASDARTVVAARA